VAGCGVLVDQTFARGTVQQLHCGQLFLSGPGGQQILCEDPSGNVIELFQAG